MDMKKIVKITTLLAACALIAAVAGCSREELDTNQFDATGVSLQAYGPQPVVRGGTLRFIGSNLQDIASVTIPGIAPITSIEVVKSGVPSEIRVTVPKDGPQPGFVTLTTKSGATLTTKTQISYDEPIEITAITPSSVYPGEEITITGDYLNLIHEVIFEDDVKVSEKAFSKHDRYSITVTVPAEAQTGTVGLGTIDEGEVADESLLSTLNIVEAETELTVKTAEGKLAATALKAGDEVVINGTRLDLVTAVKVEGATVTEFSKSASKISFTLPDSATDGEVFLVHASGVEVSAGTIGTAVPTNLTAAPSPVKAGRELTISGNNLDLVTGISVPGTGTVEYANDGKIVFTVPETAQEGDITLSLANGKTVSVAYTLVKPALTAANPNPASAGSEVVLTGTDLDLVKSVTFGGGIEVEAEPSETEIVLSVPTAAETGNLTLNLINGTSQESIELKVDKPAGAYIAVFPGELYSPGDMFIIDIENPDHLTEVQVNGEKVNFILHEKTLYMQIPASAGAGSQLTLISDNGAVTYTMNIDPGDFIVTPIWTGSSAISGWNGDQSLAWGGYDWSTVAPGMILRFELEPTVAAGSWWCISLRHGDNWGALAGVPGQYDTPEMPMDVVLTREILDDLIAHNGLVVTGDGFIMKSIALVQDLRYGTTIWEGEFNCSNWNGNQSLAWGGFDWSTAAPGQTLFFHMIPTVTEGEWWCISLRHGTNWGALAGVPGQYDTPESPMGVKLTQEIISDLIANSGLVVTGTGYILTKVSLK